MFMHPDEKELQSPKEPSTNPDPITGAPGAHPIGTGIGAAAGAAAGGVIGGIGGPVGAAVGAAAGAVAGGLIGKTTGEALNPTNDEARWKEHFEREGFSRQGLFEDFQPAFRAGAITWRQHGATGKSFTEVEQEVRSEFETRRGSSKLEWAQARPAALFAWNYLAHPAHRLDGYEVADRNGNAFGKVDRVWTRPQQDLALVSVKTGWIAGAFQVFPAHEAQIMDKNRRIMLPFSQEQIRKGPSFSNVEELTETDWKELLAYYGAPEELAPTNAG